MRALKLGDKVRDTVTGLEGTVVVESRFLNGCRRLGVQPELDKDGKMPDQYSFDEQQLELLKKEVVKDTPAKTGGPMKREKRVP